MKIFLSILLLPLAALAAPSHDKFSDRIADELRGDRRLLQSLRVGHETEARYLLSEDAYRAAVIDLEDYQDGQNGVTQERLTNDALEVWMDLAPYRDSTGVMKY